MANDITQSTEYGGKDAPTWVKNGFYLPGYHNAFLSVSKKSTGEEVIALSFKVSPSTFADARSKLYQLIRTMGGWMIQRLGNQPIEISLGGYMLDMKGVLERHDFIDNYKRYIEDQKNYTTDYYNEYHTKLVVEGREYYGIITGLTFSKQASNSPFLYQYNLSFIALGEKRVYNTNYALEDAAILEKKTISESTTKNTYISPIVESVLNTSDMQSTAIPVEKYSEVNSEESAIFEYTNVKNNQVLSTTEDITKAEISLMENNTLDNNMYYDYEFTTEQERINYGDSNGNLVIRVPLPQDIISDSYNISWNLHQVAVNDISAKTYYSPMEDNPWWDGPNRNQYLSIILKYSENLRKKVQSYAENHYVFPAETANNYAVHHIKSFINASLDKIIAGCNHELTKPTVEPSESDYLITDMENIAQSIYTFVTQK